MTDRLQGKSKSIQYKAQKQKSRIQSKHQLTMTTLAMRKMTRWLQHLHVWTEWVKIQQPTSVCAQEHITKIWYLERSKMGNLLHTWLYSATLIDDMMWIPFHTHMTLLYCLMLTRLLICSARDISKLYVFHKYWLLYANNHLWMPKNGYLSSTSYFISYMCTL